MGISLQRGITAVELLAVGAIFLLLVAGVMPKMNDFSRKSEMYDVHKSLYTALQVARAAAVNEGQVVSLCASSDGTTCTKLNWKGGWLVQSEGSTLRSATERHHQIIQYFGNQSEFAPLVFNSDKEPIFKVSFNSEGYTTTDSRLMSVVCDHADEDAFNFALTINRSGYVVASNVSEFIDQQMGSEVTAAQAAQDHCSNS